VPALLTGHTAGWRLAEQAGRRARSLPHSATGRGRRSTSAVLVPDRRQPACRGKARDYIWL